MREEKWKKRDKKRNKKKHGMRVSGFSVILIQEVLIKKKEDKNKK